MTEEKRRKVSVSSSGGDRDSIVKAKHGEEEYHNERKRVSYTGKIN